MTLFLLTIFIALLWCYCVSLWSLKALIHINTEQVFNSFQVWNDMRVNYFCELFHWNMKNNCYYLAKESITTLQTPLMLEEPFLVLQTTLWAVLKKKLLYRTFRGMKRFHGCPKSVRHCHWFSTLLGCAYLRPRMHQPTPACFMAARMCTGTKPSQVLISADEVKPLKRR